MKNSEPIFADYLTLNAFNAQYEKRIGSSDPDFSIWDDHGQPFAYWDVKDRKFSDKDKERLEEAIRRAESGEPGLVESGPDQAYEFVRKKIEFKAKQFEKCGSVPGMMVLAEWAGCVHPTPNMVAAALEGWPTIVLKPGSSNEPPLFQRSADGTMWDEHSKEIYRSISAIGFLSYKRVNRYKYGLNSFAEEAVRRISDIQHVIGLIEEEENRQRAAGIDLDYQEPVLDIYRINCAHFEWPEGAVGRFDRVYTYHPTLLEYVLTTDGLLPKEKQELPLSEDHLTIEALLSDPMLRA